MLLERKAHSPIRLIVMPTNTLILSKSRRSSLLHSISDFIEVPRTKIMGVHADIHRKRCTNGSIRSACRAAQPRDSCFVKLDDLEFQAGVKGDHAWRAIASQTHSKQARGRGGRVGQCSEANLRCGLSGNAGKHQAR